MSTPSTDVQKQLELAHEDVVAERDRLRSARAAISSRLGPLPASAGIVIGLVGGLDHRVERGFLIAAIVMFALVMLVSIRYSRLPPYRLLRARRVLPDDAHKTAGEAPTYLGSTVARQTDAALWLSRKIDLDGRIYGPLRKYQGVNFRTFLEGLRSSPPEVDDLQTAFDVELTALNVVQALYAGIVVVLVIGIVVN